MPAKRLPPFCGQGLNDPFLYNPYQVELLDKRRQRICAVCTTIAPVDGHGVFRCPKCHAVERSQLVARKAFHRIGIVAGRRSGKTKVGAHAAREEVIVPNALGWIVGPTYKIMHDSTMPAFFRLIPPSWVADWNAKNYDLTLVNGHLVQFRSLDDVSRGVGVGLYWLWMDECQKVRERAWDILRPALTDHVGNAIFTWTPNGFDWTWRRLYRPAFDTGKYHIPGFWMAKCRTIDNPHIQKYGMQDVEEARLSMPPEMFRQEYLADFVSFAGNIYDWEVLEKRVLRGDDVKAFIPEWPKIDPSRQGIVGIGGGVTHPLAALMIVPTEKGLVVVDNYLREHRSVGFQFDMLRAQFNAHSTVENRHIPMRFAADEDKKYLFREAAHKGIGVVPTEHYLMTGIQRAQSWIYSDRLWFAGERCEKALDQLREYRWNDLLEEDDGQRTDSERDFLKDEEFCKALHAALLSYPEIPTPPTPLSQRELSLSPRVRSEISEWREYERREAEGEDTDDGFTPNPRSYELGDFYRSES